MKSIYKILAFISNFSIGISSPVLCLMLCEHGCTLNNVGLVVTVFAVTVLIAEIPSGIFADMYGRKLSFIASHVAGALSAIVLFVSNSFILAAAGLSLAGLSAAFASGSLDALAVEDTVRSKGEAAMTRTISSLLAYQCAGLALGALLGGFLPYTQGYSLHLMSKFAVCLLTVPVALILPKESRSKAHKMKHALRKHLGVMARLMQKSSALICIAVCILSMSIMQAALEIYWQPQFSGILVSDSLAKLGALSATAYLATTFGCVILGRANLASPRRGWTLYLSLGAAIAFLTAALSLATNAVLFFGIYTIIYLLVGMLSVPEQTIINTEATDDVRASILSVTSFASRTGGMISGALCSLLFTVGDIGFVWRVTALIALVGIIAASISRIPCSRAMSPAKRTDI